MGAKYRLVGDEDDDLWCEAEEASGLFTTLDGGLRRVELIGCTPRRKLQYCLDHIGGRRALAGNASLSFLDTSGTEIAAYFVNDVRVEAFRSSSHGTGRVDVTVTLVCERPLEEEQGIWDLVRRGALDSNGLWHTLDAAGRLAWLSVALQRKPGKPIDDRPGTVYELDGSHMVDRDSFYCALGEAVNGPGGYFGWNLDALADCLRGNFGATSPFTLIWHDSELARAHLTKQIHRSGAFFEVVMEVLGEGKVEVVMR